jgi:pimeloyl-ACP methyl ester carboxylesterase
MKVNANGIAFNCEVSGADGAPWLVFSNSLATNLYMWDRQAADLADRFHILRYDQRGHGLTDAPAGRYSFDTLIADVIALMDALGYRWAAPPAWAWCRSIPAGSVTWRFATTQAGHPRRRTGNGRSGSLSPSEVPCPRCWNRPCSAGFHRRR